MSASTFPNFLRKYSLTLIWEGLGVGGNFTPAPPCWFSLNNSETVKAVTLVFSRIQLDFIRDIRAKFGISNLPQPPDIGQISEGGISDFRFSCQSLIKKIAIIPEPVMILT